MLGAELDEHLDYTRYDYKNKKTNNSRNGIAPKKLFSNFGEITVSLSRGKLREFEPVTVKKDISKKWTQPVRNCGYILNQLYIYFGD